MGPLICRTDHSERSSATRGPQQTSSSPFKTYSWSGHCFAPFKDRFRPFETSDSGGDSRILVGTHWEVDSADTTELPYSLPVTMRQPQAPRSCPTDVVCAESFSNFVLDLLQFLAGVECSLRRRARAALLFIARIVLRATKKVERSRSIHYCICTNEEELLD